MIRYLSKFSLFVGIGLLILWLLCDFIMANPMLFNPNHFDRWFSTYQVMSKSERNIESDTLFLGDSVAGQLIRPEENKNHLAYTAAILTSGQFILAYNAIKNNPRLKQIILILGPLNIGDDFEQFTTYAYFVKPFYTTKNQPHITPHLQAKIDQAPYSNFFQYSVAKLLPFSDIDYSDYKKPSEKFRFSELSISYLKKIVALCEKEKIQLSLFSGPVKQSYLTNSNDWEIYKKQIKEEGLESLFEDYFESILYLEDEKFIDGIHVHQEYIATCKTHLLNYISEVAAKD